MAGSLGRVSREVVFEPEPKGFLLVYRVECLQELGLDGLELGLADDLRLGWLLRGFGRLIKLVFVQLLLHLLIGGGAFFIAVIIFDSLLLLLLGLRWLVGVGRWS